MTTFIVTVPAVGPDGQETTTESVRDVLGDYYDLSDFTCTAEDLARYGSDEIDMVLADLADAVKEVNVTNGWYEEGRTFGDEIALLHSEVSEALEEFRAGRIEICFRGPDKGIYSAEQVNRMVADGRLNFDPDSLLVTLPTGSAFKPEGVPSEAADILVRLLDFTDRYGIDLGLEFRRKLAFNRTRGHKHGGKAL